MQGAGCGVQGAGCGCGCGVWGAGCGAVKTDLTWPTLTDDKSDSKDVVLFYEFEDDCAFANNCRGMSAREKLLAFGGRCKGLRQKKIH